MFAPVIISKTWNRVKCKFSRSAWDLLSFVIIGYLHTACHAMSSYKCCVTNRFQKRSILSSVDIPTRHPCDNEDFIEPFHSQEMITGETFLTMALSNKSLMRIFYQINHGKLSWYYFKFSQQANKDIFFQQRKIGVKILGVIELVYSMVEPEFNWFFYSSLILIRGRSDVFLNRSILWWYFRLFQVLSLGCLVDINQIFIVSLTESMYW